MILPLSVAFFSIPSSSIASIVATAAAADTYYIKIVLQQHTKKGSIVSTALAPYVPPIDPGGDFFIMCPLAPFIVDYFIY